MDTYAVPSAQCLDAAISWRGAECALGKIIFDVCSTECMMRPVTPWKKAKKLNYKQITALYDAVIVAPNQSATKLLQFGKCESWKAYTTKSPQIRYAARALKQKRAYDSGNCSQWKGTCDYWSADWVLWIPVAWTPFAAAKRSSGWILSWSAHNICAWPWH